MGFDKLEYVHFFKELMASLQCSEDWRTFHKQSGSFFLFHEAEEVIHLHPKQIISNKEFIVKPSKVLCS